MARYKDTSTKTVKNSFETARNGKQVYSTTIYREVPERDEDIYIITTDGDRLDTLSNDFYGTPNLWWFIAHTNNITTMNVAPGTSLRISTNREFARGL